MKNTGIWITALICGTILVVAILVRTSPAPSLQNNPQLTDSLSISSSDTSTDNPVKKQATKPSNSNNNSAIAECSKNAKESFDNAVALTTNNGQYPIKGSWTYQNHFNISDGKCYMVQYLTTADSSGKGLYDVMENKNIANYTLLTSNNSISCNINNNFDCTKNQFESFVDSKMNG